MGDLTSQSDQLIDDARQLRDDNRAGGRHRKATGSIGKGSASLKVKHWTRKLVRILIAIFGILIVSSVAGMLLNGLGFAGVMMTFLAIIAAIVAFSVFPKMQEPKRVDLTKGDARDMVSKTELWLEHQRPALPAPAANIVDDMGVQLDMLGQQLAHVDPNHPTTREIRSLVGEALPETIESYRKIPANLRHETRDNTPSPDQQLTTSLDKISKELDSVNRQLAEGSLDDLAIKSRYLDYKYGDGAAAIEDGRKGS